MNKDKEISIQCWVGKGVMTNAYALDADHEMHPYNQALRQGVKPEDYGIRNPYEDMFASYDRSMLIAEILQLRKEITSIYAYGLDR